ncbi:hypothetical protein [Campylobacter coli]|uniref:hypothetical protein n=1 Tax=Campylobacter coli TaxID=195 RepID=UPI00092F7AD9|nr:hypothetical protein [Campylobacter coli]
MSQTNNNTEIKEQDTQDEIIWELKRKVTFMIIWAYGSYFGFIIFVCFLLFVSGNKFKVDNWKAYVVMIVIVFAIIFFTKRLYRSLNLKRMYIDNNYKLYIEKYIGKDLILESGSYVIGMESNFYLGITMSSIAKIISLNCNGKELYGFIESANTNFNELANFTKSHLINYLISCENNKYLKAAAIYGLFQLEQYYNIDLKEIDKIRLDKNEYGK